MHNPFRSNKDKGPEVPKDGPPSYDTATASDPSPAPQGQKGNPFVSVTDPAGHSGVPDSKDHGLYRTESGSSEVSHIDTYKAERLMDDDKLRELDDEMRELPEGWVRCFDPKQKHHFYVEEATRRSIWVHPYDDPEFLSKLPDTHPANPHSKEAQQARQQAEDEALAWQLHQEELQASGQADGAPASQGMGRVVGGKGDDKPDFGSGPSPFGKSDSSNAAGFHESRSNPYESEPTPQEGKPWSSYKDGGGGSSNKHRNWFQREKDKVIGTKEERAKAKEERRKQKELEKERLRKQQEEYLRRRQELIDKQINEGTIGGGIYNSDPYAYDAPSTPFSRGYGNTYGYGYNGGYGRRYGYGPYGGGYYGGLGYGGLGYGGLGYGGLGYGGLGYGGYGYGGGFGPGAALGLGGGLLGGALLTDALLF